MRRMHSVLRVHIDHDHSFTCPRLPWSQGTRVVGLHARTEPHSRYAIFFIQSGGQVKNIVLNIILYHTAAGGYFHSRHASAPGEILSGVSWDAIARHYYGVQAARSVIIQRRRDVVLAYVSQNALNWNRNRFISSSPEGYRLNSARRELERRDIRNFAKCIVRYLFAGWFCGRISPWSGIASCPALEIASISESNIISGASQHPRFSRSPIDHRDRARVSLAPVLFPP